MNTWSSHEVSCHIRTDSCNQKCYAAAQNKRLRACSLILYCSKWVSRFYCFLLWLKQCGLSFFVFFCICYLGFDTGNQSEFLFARLLLCYCIFTASSIHFTVCFLSVFAFYYYQKYLPLSFSHARICKNDLSSSKYFQGMFCLLLQDILLQDILCSSKECSILQVITVLCKKVAADS